MGKKAKTSRKGKKAWRANISTEDIGDFYEKSTKDALSGGPLTDVSSESLFFVDKSSDLSVKRKIEKHREKVLRCDSLLQRNPYVQAVPSSKDKKSHRKGKQVQKEKDAVQGSSKEKDVPDSGMSDLWDDKGEPTRKTKKKPKTTIIPAVEVEPPGCSFNPAFESHQDSLACAVADEMQKIYRQELGPEPVPLTVPGEAIDEEDMYFLDADDASDNDDQNIKNEDGNEVDERENRPSATKRVTRVVLNKRNRRKEQLRAEAKAKKVKQLSKEIDSLSDIVKEIEKDDNEKQKRHRRREVSKQERLKVRPPRLGKHKFQAAPMQVLLSEEITGSLRKLKPCSTLARDRFKSLEKRGLVVPSAKSGRK